MTYNTLLGNARATFDTLRNWVDWLLLIFVLSQIWIRAVRFADAVIDWVKASSAKKLAEGRRALREGNCTPEGQP